MRMGEKKDVRNKMWDHWVYLAGKKVSKLPKKKCFKYISKYKSKENKLVIDNL